MSISYNKKEMFCSTVKDLRIFLNCIPDDTPIIDLLGDEYVFKLMVGRNDDGNIIEYIDISTEPAE